MRSNVEFFKIIDIAVQSALFILFGYLLDSSGSSYTTIFFLLLLVQIASAAIHFFLKSVKLFKNERLIYLISLFIWFGCYVYIRKHVPEYNIGVRGPNGINMFPVHEIVVIATGLALAFWYITISFREVKIFFKKNHN